MSDKAENRSFFSPGSTAFHYSTTSGDSASGGSGGSGMECIQLRSPPGPFQYLITEQAKSLVALQELQNEVGALLEFRDLVIETFPNLRSKMSPSTPAISARRDWEPGVRVRRKLVSAPATDSSRTKPQASVQDSGFSTETSCGKEGSSSAAANGRSVDDELWSLLDEISLKSAKLREQFDLLRGELAFQEQSIAEDDFSRRYINEETQECADCATTWQIRKERDALLAENAQLETNRAVALSPSTSTPLGRLDEVLETPVRNVRVQTLDPKKFAAILQESNPVELQRQLLVSTVHAQVLLERLNIATNQKNDLLARLERTKEENDDLKFQLEEKCVELETSKRSRQLESRSIHNSMRDMEPVQLPSPGVSDTPRRRPSRIPCPPRRASPAPRRVSPHSRLASASPAAARRIEPTPRSRRPSSNASQSTEGAKLKHKKDEMVLNDSARATAAPASKISPEEPKRLIVEYLSRMENLAKKRYPLFSRLMPQAPTPTPIDEMKDFAYESPVNLATEISKSILYNSSLDFKKLASLNSNKDSEQYAEESLWNGKPQHYFESINNDVAEYCSSLNYNDNVDNAFGSDVK